MALQQNPADGATISQPTTIFKSVCRSCHGGCGTLLHVRDGVLVKVDGDPQSPLNHGLSLS
jgi:anaerobic selenocysteine-containing dehydrogenase